MNAENVKIGFIGFGNMAGALADGLLKSGAVPGERMYACAAHWEKLVANTEPKDIHPCRTAADVAQAADIVVIAVKPYLVAEVCEPIKDLLAEKVVFSVVYGVNYDFYEQILLPGTRHLSTIPNTPVSVCEGVIVCEEQNSLTEEDWTVVRDTFGATGLLQLTPTKQMGIAGTLASCGPAFTAMYLEALADGAVKQGLPRAAAYQLASQMVAGTAKMQLEYGTHPGAMKDAVCSPGGVTIVGVAALERRAFRSAVIDAIDEVSKK